MNPHLKISRYIGSFARSPLGRWRDLQPWELTARVPALVRELLVILPMEEFSVADEIAVHRSAIVEAGAVLKGPLILGAGCFVADGAYLRGGNWVAEGCTIGPGSELKSSFLFAGTRLAHFNFVGDSILGADVNLEAGSILCNYRNERTDREILVRAMGALIPTGCEKFGALVGDGSRIGANAVVAPGGLLLPGTVVPRTALWDPEAPA